PPPGSEPRTRFWRGPKVDGPLRRSSEDRVVAGVAAGLGKRFGFDPTVVRIAFALMAFGGTGLVAYVAAWLFLRRDDEETSIAQRSMHDPKATVLAIGLASVVIVLLLLLQVVGLGFAAGLTWPLALAAGGLAIIWRQADEYDRAALRRVTDRLPGLPELGLRSRRAAVARIALGIGLVA